MAGGIDADVVARVLLLLTGLVFFSTTVYALGFIWLGRMGSARPEDRSLRTFPAITAVIAAKNEAAVLPATLSRLLEMPYPAGMFRILVAVDEGDQETAAACLPFSDRVSVVFTTSRNGKPGVLNEVLPRVETELIFLLDADSLPDRDAFNRMVPLITDDGFIASSAQGYPLNTGEGIFPRFFNLECRIQADLNANKSRAGYFAYIPGFCSLVRTDEIRRVGGWDESCLSEDSDLALRIWAAGGRISESAAMVGMEAPAKLSPFFRQRLRWYRGMLDSYRQRWRLLLKVPFMQAADVTVQFLSPAIVALFLPFCIGSLLTGGIPLLLLACTLIALVTGAVIIRGAFSPAERVLNALMIFPFLLLNSVICIIVVITFLLNRKIPWTRTEKSNYGTKNGSKKIPD
jgi:cellulose synthase/poly-beta-1,6-N-acetylglucosamine synthase-like glycosyltransferase